VTTSLILYTLGLRIGGERLRRLIKRFERFGILFTSDVDKASEVFERHGGKAILIGHLIPGVGALISVPAGLKRMPIRWRFLGYTVLGGTLWTGVGRLGVGARQPMEDGGAVRVDLRVRSASRPHPRSPLVLMAAMEGTQMTENSCRSSYIEIPRESIRS
jgi:SNARE associated Golgi protein